MDDLDQLFSCAGPRTVTRSFWVDHVLAYVVLDHLGYEAIQCPAAGSNLLQDRRAARVILEGTLDRLELAANATELGYEVSVSLFRC